MPYAPDIHAWNPENGPRPEEWQYEPPTARQLAFAERLAAERGTAVPAHAYRSKGLCGMFIAAMTTRAA